MAMQFHTTSLAMVISLIWVYSFLWIYSIIILTYNFLHNESAFLKADTSDKIFFTLPVM